MDDVATLPSASAASFPEAALASPEESALLRAAVAGDARALDALVRLHHRRVYGYLCQMTRHRADAEDLTQQTFIKAIRCLDRADPARPLIPWLLTIARRTALNHFRDGPRWDELPFDLAGGEMSPAGETELRDQADALWARARRTLSAREFEALWLRCAEELPLDETARLMGLTQIHVKVLVHRARQKLLKTETPA